MPKHYLAARGAARSHDRRRRPANDNHGAPRDVMLQAALRRYAAYGPDMADLARRQAEASRAADDRQSYIWWLEVCSALEIPGHAGLSAAIGR